MDEYFSQVFGEKTLHLPMWMYVQNQAPGLVSFIGASRIDSNAPEHPLRFGSSRSHQFVKGEFLIRPHAVLGTDALRGKGLGGLITDPRTVGEMLANGEYIIGGE